MACNVWGIISCSGSNFLRRRRCSIAKRSGFNEECDIDGSFCGSLVCENDCTCKTEPTPGVCGVWFSGAAAAYPPDNSNFQTPFNLTDVFTDMFGVDHLLSNWVANGNYPDNAAAFPNAAATTFDGIAIDADTRLELWDGPNYTGNKVVDETGPMIINNFMREFSGVLVGDYSVANCFGLAAATPSWSNCMVSDLDSDGMYDGGNENMNNWSNGSCKITCTAP